MNLKNEQAKVDEFIISEGLLINRPIVQRLIFSQLKTTNIILYNS